MPVVSAWVMPMGLLGLAAYPFGFDDVFWRLMGYGIDWMVVVAQWVAGIPGAVGRVAAFGTGPLLLATLGLLVICLLRTRLRWIGAALMAGAALWVLLYPQPDVYISADGEAAMIRGADGRLSVLHRGRDTFAIREWLAADADPRDVRDKSLTQGVRCDEDGCVGTMRGGSLAAMSLTQEAFLDDCSRAAIVVSPHDAPGACAALTFDRRRLRSAGAVAVYRHGPAFEAAVSRPPGESRPWYGAPAATKESQRSAARDARPPAATLDADDQ
jgi:competence protein ComEC